MKLVGYVRVSTSGQVDDGFGLNIQTKAIEEWTRQASHTLIATYSDEGASGTDAQREGLGEALGAVKFNGADGVVVHSLDRLARSLTVQEAALQQIWNAGGRVFAVDTGEVQADDPDDPVRTFVRQILGAVSELEAGMIRRRLRRGRLHKALSGGYSHGAPPFGFRAVDGCLEPDESEQSVIATIRHLRAGGLSYRQIAETLNKDGIPAKRGGIWHPQTVSRALASATTKASSISPTS